MNSASTLTRSSTKLRTAGIVAAIAGALALGSAGPAVAQAPYDEPNGCTEETLHPEYQGQGLCEEPAEEDPVEPTTPPAEPTPPSQPAPTINETVAQILGGLF